MSAYIVTLNMAPRQAELTRDAMRAKGEVMRKVCKALTQLPDPDRMALTRFTLSPVDGDWNTERVEWDGTPVGTLTARWVNPTTLVYQFTPFTSTSL